MAASECKSLAKSGAAYITRRVLPILAKGVAAKFIGHEGAAELADIATLKEEDVSGLASKLAEDSLSRHKSISKSIQDFKKQLTKTIDGFPERTDAEGSKFSNKKLIIFVDELDRCRPSYAIQILECIKHLFDVPGVIFILAIDVEQLEATIEKTYGAADSGESYLRKFVDWQLNIPKPRADKFARKLYDDFNLQEANVLFGNDNILNGYKPMIDAIGVVAGSFNLTLRQIAQIFTDINLYIRKLPKNDSPFSFTLGLVASLRHAIPPEKLRSYCGGKDDYEALIQGLIQSISPLASSDLRDKLGRWKPHFLAMFLNKEHESSLVKEWKFLEEQKRGEKTAEG